MIRKGVFIQQRSIIFEGTVFHLCSKHRVVTGEERELLLACDHDCRYSIILFALKAIYRDNNPIAVEVWKLIHADPGIAKQHRQFCGGERVEKVADLW
ncbi:hypothetical protein D3C81_1835770 [compost metagenome]